MGEIDRFFDEAPQELTATASEVENGRGHLEERRVTVSNRIYWLEGERRFPGEYRFPCISQLPTGGKPMRLRTRASNSSLRRLTAYDFYDSVRRVDSGAAAMSVAFAVFHEKSRPRSLLDHVARIEDPRRTAHRLDEILFLVVCGTMADCDDYEAIAATRKLSASSRIKIDYPGSTAVSRLVSIACAGEKVGAFDWLEAFYRVSYGFLERVDCSRARLGQQGLQLGEVLLDGVEIVTVGRRIA